MKEGKRFWLFCKGKYLIIFYLILEASFGKESTGQKQSLYHHLDNLIESYGDLYEKYGCSLGKTVCRGKVKLSDVTT